MPCPPQVPISIIPPVATGQGPLVWQNGNQITRLTKPLNPSWLVYDGNQTRWGDGSQQAPIMLPNLQQVLQNSINYAIGLNAQGQLAAYANTTINPNNSLVTATGSNTPRTLANRFADVVNVKDFGATGNGITDDTTAIQAAVTYAVSIGATTVYFPNGNYNYTYFQLPDGIGFKFESSTVAGNKISPQLGSASFCVDPFVYQAPANHQNKYYFASADIVGCSGSGTVGPASADYGKLIQMYKDNWSSSTQANVGEIDGMYISIYQGTNQSIYQSDAAGILSNVTQLAGTGFTAFCEVQNSVVAPTTLAVQKQIDIQIAPINENTNGYLPVKYADGISIGADVGNLDNAIIIQDNGITGTWNNILVSLKQSSQIQLKHKSTNGDLLFSDGNVSTNSIYKVIPQARFISSTSTALTVNSNFLDQVYAISSSSACTVTLPFYDTDGVTPLRAGFSFQVIQFGGSKITFQATSPALLRNVNSQYSTGGAYAVVTLQLISNVWVLSGDTGT